MGSINKSSCNYDPETPGLPRRYAAPASWQKVEPHEIAKFAKCRPVGIDTALIKQLSRGDRKRLGIARSSVYRALAMRRPRGRVGAD